MFGNNVYESYANAYKSYAKAVDVVASSQKAWWDTLTGGNDENKFTEAVNTFSENLVHMNEQNCKMTLAFMDQVVKTNPAMENAVNETKKFMKTQSKEYAKQIEKFSESL